MTVESIVTDAPEKMCESCGQATVGHHVVFADGGRFEVCSHCLPAALPVPRQR